MFHHSPSQGKSIPGFHGRFHILRPYTYIDHLIVFKIRSVKFHFPGLHHERNPVSLLLLNVSFKNIGLPDKISYKFCLRVIVDLDRSP